MQQFKNLLQLQRHFNNELTCIEYIEQQRWGGTPLCPHCGSEHHYRTATRLKSPELKGYKDFWCKACNKKFTSLTGTIYNSTKVSLQAWICGVYLATAHKKGISSVQLAKDLGVTQKTAWYMLHRIREMVREKNPTALKNTVEVDETFIGGRMGNKSLSKRAKLKAAGIQGYMDKTPVLGFLERNGKVRATVVPGVRGEILKPLVKQNIDKSATLVTDNFGGYKDLDQHFAEHQIINHTLSEYVRGNVHTNSIEGFWSLLKRSIYGIYHQVSPKHLQRYCDEMTYKYNSKEIRDNERFEDAMSKCGESELRYKLLIGK